MITRIATTRTSLFIEANRKISTITINKADLLAVSQTKLDEELTRQYGTSLAETITLHKNRDGRISMAVGIPPTVWPEDESR